MLPPRDIQLIIWPYIAVRKSVQSHFSQLLILNFISFSIIIQKRATTASDMSLNSQQNLLKDKFGLQPLDHLIKNLMLRVDSLQARQARSLTTRVTLQDESNTEIQRIKQTIASVVNSNLNNLKSLEQNTRLNWEEVLDRVKNFQNKFIRLLKDQEEAYEYLELRVISVETSQRNVTQFMKKVGEQQTLKYSGVPALEERIKQIEHIFQLKNQNISERAKANEQKGSMETNKILRQVKEIERSLQQIKEENKQQREKAKKNQSIDRVQESIEGLEEKMKTLQMQAKQQKRRNSKLEQLIQSVKEDMKKVSQANSNLQNRINLLQKFEVKDEGQKKSFKTQYHQNNDHFTEDPKQGPLHQKKNSKNSQPWHLSEPNKNYYDEQGSRGIKSRLQLNQKQKNSEKKQINKVQTKNDDHSDEDPFRSMGAGIRGLLRKSKQKQETKNPYLNQNTLKSKQPLKRQNKLEDISIPKGRENKNLPPVRPDMKRINQVSNDNSQMSSEEQAYYMDEEGYLVDENGDYILDEHGNQVLVNVNVEEEY